VGGEEIMGEFKDTEPNPINERGKESVHVGGAMFGLYQLLSSNRFIRARITTRKRGCSVRNTYKAIRMISRRFV